MYSLRPGLFKLVYKGTRDIKKMWTNGSDGILGSLYQQIPQILQKMRRSNQSTNFLWINATILMKKARLLGNDDSKTLGESAKNKPELKDFAELAVSLLVDKAELELFVLDSNLRDTEGNRIAGKRSKGLLTKGQVAKPKIYDIHLCWERGSGLTFSNSLTYLSCHALLEEDRSLVLTSSCHGVCIGFLSGKDFHDRVRHVMKSHLLPRQIKSQLFAIEKGGERRRITGVTGLLSSSQTANEIRCPLPKNLSLVRARDHTFMPLLGDLCKQQCDVPGGSLLEASIDSHFGLNSMGAFESCPSMKLDILTNEDSRKAFLEAARGRDSGTDTYANHHHIRLVYYHQNHHNYEGFLSMDSSETEKVAKINYLEYVKTRGNSPTLRTFQITNSGAPSMPLPWPSPPSPQLSSYNTCTSPYQYYDISLRNSRITFKASNLVSVTRPSNPIIPQQKLQEAISRPPKGEEKKRNRIAAEAYQKVHLKKSFRLLPPVCTAPTFISQNPFAPLYGLDTCGIVPTATAFLAGANCAEAYTESEEMFGATHHATCGKPTLEKHVLVSKEKKKKKTAKGKIMISFN